MSRTSIELLPVITTLPPVVVRAESPKSVSDAPETFAPPESNHNVVESLVRDVPDLSLAKSILIIGTVCSMMLMNSLLTGVLTVGLPTIAHDVALKESLLLWYVSQALSESPN